MGRVYWTRDYNVCADILVVSPKQLEDISQYSKKLLSYIGIYEDEHGEYLVFADMDTLLFYGIEINN